MFGECPTSVYGEEIACSRTRLVRGRKDYCCCECCRVIPKGVQHEHATGVVVGDGWVSSRTCMLCRNVRDSLFKGDCIYGMLWETLQYHYGDEGGWFDPPTRPIEE